MRPTLNLSATIRIVLIVVVLLSLYYDSSWDVVAKSSSSTWKQQSKHFLLNAGYHHHHSRINCLSYKVTIQDPVLLIPKHYRKYTWGRQWKESSFIKYPSNMLSMLIQYRGGSNSESTNPEVNLNTEDGNNDDKDNEIDDNDSSTVVDTSNNNHDDSETPTEGIIDETDQQNTVPAGTENDGQELPNSIKVDDDDNDDEEEENNDVLDSKTSEEEGEEDVEELEVDEEDETDDHQSDSLGEQKGDSEKGIQIEMSEVNEYDDPYVPSPMTNMYISLGVMLLGRKVDLLSPLMVRITRFLFIAYVIVHQVFLFYVRIQAKVMNDRTPIQLSNPLSSLIQNQLSGSTGAAASTMLGAAGGGMANDMIKGIASSFLTSQSTIMEYDLKQTRSMQSGLIFNMIFMWFLHFKMGQVQPLLIQSLNGISSMIYSPLFQIYILGRNLERPFKAATKAAPSTEGETESDPDTDTDTTTDTSEDSNIEASEIDQDDDNVNEDDDIDDDDDEE